MSQLPPQNKTNAGETNAGETNESDAFSDVSFVVRQSYPIQKLPGFTKPTHRVPTACDQKSQSFVGRLGVRLVRDDLDGTFQSLRSGFGFKRRDLESTDDVEGFGTIQTPHFLFSSAVFQSSQDPSQAIWQRDISQIRQPEVFLSHPGAFAQTFDTVDFAPPSLINLEKLIDHIEDLDGRDVQADYDRNVTYCKIGLKGLIPKVHVTEESLQIIHPEPTALPTLLASVQDVQTKLLCFTELTS